MGCSNFFFDVKKSKSHVNRSSGNLSNMKEKITTKNKLTKKKIKRTIFEPICIIKQINVN